MKLFTALVFYLVINFSSFAQTGPKVISAFPSNQLVNAAANTQIIITFDSPINPATITDTSLYIFGRWSGIAEGNISFDSENKILTFDPQKPFYPGELVFVNLSRKIKNSLGEQMEFGYAWHFWIKTGTGTMDLVKVKEIDVREPGEGWIQTYGAYAGDLDKDGYTDFLVPNEVANDVRVFMNDGKGDYSDFTIFPMQGGARPSTNEGADFNLDGLMDIAVGNSVNKLVTVFLGNGTGNFSSIENYTADLEVRGLMTIDVNGDGFIDIVTANRAASNITILTNSGDGTFSPSDTIETGGNGETTCSAADVNSDGIIDLFVGAISSREIILLLGDGNGSFTFHNKVSVTGSPWFTCSGDMNEDGIADIVSANSSGNVLSVIFCDSLGNFSEPVYYPTGSFPLSTDLGDVDGDGDLDVVASNYSSGDFTLYENDGTGVLINRRDLKARTAGSCSVFHDRDNDGDLDMTGVDEIDDLLILFENKGLVPVELISFYNNVNGNIVTLHWETASEINNQGFGIYRNGNKIAFVDGKGTTTEKQEYSFIDKDLQSGIYNYRLNQIDFDGTQEVVGELTIYLFIPEQYSLEQNYPNPFNPSTAISFSIPASEFVILKIFDVLGNEVATLVNEEKLAGNYKIEFSAKGGSASGGDATQLSNGIYFYEIVAGEFRATKKMILLK